MPPIVTPSSTLRALSRFTHSKLGRLQTVRPCLPRPPHLSLQPDRSQRFQPFSSSFLSLNSLPKDSAKERQKSHLVEQPENPQPPTLNRREQPSYDITFTCTPCSTRSTHRITKHAYHYGSILITCPSCRNRHIISDHLNIFGDKYETIEDLMRDRGQLVKKGTLSEDGDLEFWEDGTTTTRLKKDDVTSEMDGPKNLE